MIQNIRTIACMLIAATVISTHIHAYDLDLILEFKGAYFLPFNHTFRKIYHNGGAIWGPELTGRLYKGLYGFVSTDVFLRKGKSIGLCVPTKVTMVDIGVGLKYLAPFSYGDFYIGLGVLPTYLRTNNKSPYVVGTQTKWSCGGIGQIGAYFNLPKSFVIDLFAHFSFANAKGSCNNACTTNTTCNNACDDSCNTACNNTGVLVASSVNLSAVQPLTAHLSGAWFGAGIGYRWGSESQEEYE